MSDMEEAAKPVTLQMAQAAQSGITIALSREHARELAVWAQNAALAYEPTSDIDRVGTVAIGAGSPRRQAGARLAGLGSPQCTGLRYGGCSRADGRQRDACPPAGTARSLRALMMEIVYHHITLPVLITDLPGQAWPQFSPVKWKLMWPAFGMAEFLPNESHHQRRAD
jgi:hypothetical protein